MLAKNKIPLIILAILVLSALALAGAGFYLLQQERAKTASLEQELAGLNTKLSITVQQVEDYKKMLTRLESNLQQAKSEINTLTADLAGEKNAKLEAIASIEQLKVDLKQQNQLRLGIEDQVAKLQSEMQKAQTQLGELQAKRVELEDQIKAMQVKATESVQLGEIVVTPESGQKPEQEKTGPLAIKKEAKSVAEGKEGKILVVNKEYNFVVINLGAKDDINIGDEFVIYHNNKNIGSVSVEKVQEAMSAAGFSPGLVKNKVSEGDKVVQKIK
jgi:chromosome segregation ATPase